jgi:uncharacterized membrane protein
MRISGRSGHPEVGTDLSQPRDRDKGVCGCHRQDGFSAGRISERLRRTRQQATDDTGMDIRTRASIALVLGGALWGAIWIPLRALEAAGLGGAWAGLVIYAGAALAMGLGLILSRRPLRGLGLPLVLSGLATGAAFSLYSSSLAMTEVVRAILLFYLTPVWGTLLGIAFLGERLTTPRLAALVLALIGLVVVLGGDGFPRPRSAGDWLALASGFSWALGALLVYRAEEAGPVEQVLQHLRPSLPRHDLGRKPRAGAWRHGRRLPAGRAALARRRSSTGSTSASRGRTSSPPSGARPTRSKSCRACSRASPPARRSS